MGKAKGKHKARQGKAKAKQSDQASQEEGWKYGRSEQPRWRRTGKNKNPIDFFPRGADPFLGI
jgi:hypothetical protein